MDDDREEWEGRLMACEALLILQNIPAKTDMTHTIACRMSDFMACALPWETIIFCPCRLPQRRLPQRDDGRQDRVHRL
jgi:hypothetical protein